MKRRAGFQPSMADYAHAEDEGEPHYIGNETPPGRSRRYPEASRPVQPFRGNPASSERRGSLDRYTSAAQCIGRSQERNRESRRVYSEIKYLKHRP